MKADGLIYFTDTHLTLIAFLIFFFLFLIILFLQLKGYQKDKIQYIERLPFEGDNHELR